MRSTHSEKNQKTTKLDGIGRCAVFKKETVFNNIWHVIDHDFLRECYELLDGSKAVGIDGVTKEMYKINVDNKLIHLHDKLCSNAYKPKASRIVEIPKEDGTTRPLAITCFEDKIVQLAVSRILTKIYEPLFLPCSFGYREEIRAHDALRALMKYSNKYPTGTTAEIDLSKYFNTIPHKELLGILKEKIIDKRFLKLVEKLIRSPTMVNGKSELNTIGCPQGSICSTILSNVFLHRVIDSWFEETKHNHLIGSADMVRFADDMVFVFQFEEDAQRFYKVLPKRLEKFGLKMNEKKSSIIKSGARHAADAKCNGERLPTYKFLGFTCYWGQSQNGAWRLKYKSRADRLAAKLKSIRHDLRKSLHVETHIAIANIKRVVVGWGNYHAISDNQKQVSMFVHQSQKALFTFINRKGGRRKTTWKSFNDLLKRCNYPTHFKTTSMFTTC